MRPRGSATQAGLAANGDFHCKKRIDVAREFLNHWAGAINLIGFSAEGEHDAARAPATFPHSSVVPAGVFLLGLDLSGHPHRGGTFAGGDAGRGALSHRRRAHARLLRAERAKNLTEPG